MLTKFSMPASNKYQNVRTTAVMPHIRLIGHGSQSLIPVELTDRNKVVTHHISPFCLSLHMADSINGIYIYSGHKTQDFYIHFAPLSSGFQFQIYQYIKC